MDNENEKSFKDISRILKALKKFFTGSPAKNNPSQKDSDGESISPLSTENPTARYFKRQPLPASVWVLVGRMERLGPRGRLQSRRNTARSRYSKIL